MLLNDKVFLEPLLIQMAKSAGMKVLFTYFYPFYPQGLTGMLVLESSHISIHTWPENGYLLNSISSKKALIYHISRGVSQHTNVQKYKWPPAVPPALIGMDSN